MKTNKGLVEYAKAQLGKPYWYGTYGNEASKELYEKKKKQYPSQYKWAYAGEKGVKVQDCVGLIKGYLWSSDPQDMNPKYNSKQDKSANGMRAACKVAGNIDTLPEVQGVLVFFAGHVGVYEGNGYVIEARGHAYGVVRTKLKSRPWKWWGYCPYIEYGEEPKEEPVKNISVSLPVLREGSKNKSVRAAQLLLIGAGYKLNKYGADGDLGEETIKAVKEFQKDKGLEVDGVIGSATWKGLLGE